MNTSRKKYRRSLQVHGLVRLVLLGVVAAVVAGAFVITKNRQHSLANGKSALEAEILSLDKQIDTLDLRIAAMIDREAIARRLADFGDQLVKIERAETVITGGQDDGRAQFASYRIPQRGREEF